MEFVHFASDPVRVLHDLLLDVEPRRLALVFSTQARSKDLDFGYAEGTPFIAEMYPDAFDILRKPGYIHLIPSSGFHGDSRLGMPKMEFIRKNKVVVSEFEKIPDVYADLQRFPELRMVKAEERGAFYKEKGIPVEHS